MVICMTKEFECCQICPRNCKINRNMGHLGFCGTGKSLKVARAALHFWEEPPISGDKGSGTIFFSGCNLKCVYCQNYEISTGGKGKEITVDRFVELCLDLQMQGANNINLVTPTHYIPLIKEGILLAKEKGLKVPIVYNSSGYESVEALKELEGIVDVYLPDLKYCNDDLAIAYSKAPHYFTTATRAIREMFRQVGPCQFDENGLITKGVIVRHLLLPTHLDDSKKIIQYLYETYHDDIYISIMNQYTVIRTLPFPELNQTVTDEEYDELINFAIDLGVTNAFMQEGGTASESFIPDFFEFQG